ncbi:alpha-amylase family glycosyl hydrolase [Allochromatium vinosum]|uniref:Alpha amylase catalytic region n=1 Tax=Allochromatium vinosum (strain ATCC 17899 / DSM 180 / NBRC 103801 / NCIMB 10441 / D) TaxID=572477 RepID=D3RMF2_ALLVD|nr:alpha-amylase family glycosyl hydrolase [Allochromatium vinosum]ADC61210.1 alpha amylase catalytic region [Allochromatium vinosum DSM 180]
MYEQVSHALLNDILDDLSHQVVREDLRHFYTRLGANFYAIHSLFAHLYGHREDFKERITELTERLARAYIARPESLRRLDMEREENHNWFLSQEWTGMALYLDGFAGNLQGLMQRLPYLQELGVNMVHVMPILRCPLGASDGGYAVSDFRDIDPRAGTVEDVRALGEAMRARGMLLTLDVVVNHTSNEHDWAQRARNGDKTYQDFYYVFPNRDVPDMFEETLPEIFPETAPGNFTWDADMGKWVMTVFNTYQWDLNYSNPAVFIEMLDIVLFWANQGADILRLDAVAFLWKKIGTTSQNEREAHLILQMMKDCCQVVAPGTLFIAEAIVAPSEIIKYFGEDAVIAKECEIAYNATFMALLWDAVATKNAKLLSQGIKSLPVKLDRATWLNYVRCHDDIGLGFDDADIRACDYDPYAHRRFLVDWFTGAFEGSPARGRPFGVNHKTGDARIAGALASLAGLDAALDSGDQTAIDHSVALILTLHGMILSFGGIPLIWYGDEVGTLNDCSFLDDVNKAGDARWIHRPRIDWNRVERRREQGTVEQRIFDGLKRLIAVRKNTPAFADFNNRELIDAGNPHIFAFLRTHPSMPGSSVLVAANFDVTPQYLDLDAPAYRGLFRGGQIQDLVSGDSPALLNNRVVIPPYHFYWLADQRARSLL